MKSNLITDNNTRPVLWPSIARLIATACIFGFHYLGSQGISNLYLYWIGLLTFCFLSGCLSRLKGRKHSDWLVKRYLSVMLPYWMVIIPVLIVNNSVGYKSSTLTDSAITIFGGNMFLTNPVYVIAWYITLILLFYIYAYIDAKLLTLARGMLWVGSLVSLLYVWPNKIPYFFMFTIGLFLSPHISLISTQDHDFGKKLSKTLFFLQKYCYSFYLLHPGVILFFRNVVKLDSLPKQCC